MIPGICAANLVHLQWYGLPGNIDNWKPNHTYVNLLLMHNYLGTMDMLFNSVEARCGDMGTSYRRPCDFVDYGSTLPLCTAWPMRITSLACGCPHGDTRVTTAPGLIPGCPIARTSAVIRGRGS